MLVRSIYLLSIWFHTIIKYFICDQFDRPNLITRAIVKSGVLFIKLGQWIGTQKNILPKNIIKELRKLQTYTSIHDYAYSVEQTKEISGLEIYETIIGSGSIAQIHLGKYQDKDVVIKVTHPDVHKELERDEKLLRCILPFIPIDISTLIPEWVKQGDLRKEAYNLSVLNKLLDEFEDIHVPKVYYQSKSVLVMERINCIKFESLSSDIKMDVEIKRLMIFLYMALCVGIVHGDLHQGNILYKYTEDKKIHIYLIDPSPLVFVKDKQGIEQLLLSIINHDKHELKTFYQKKNINPFVNFKNFEEDINKEKGDVSERTISWCQKNCVIMPSDYTIVGISYLLVKPSFNNLNIKAIIKMIKYINNRKINR